MILRGWLTTSRKRIFSSSLPSARWTWERPVAFDLEFDGVATDPWGNTKAGFSASTDISRKEFGLDWNVALETGGVLVGDKIKIELDIQAVKA